MATWQENRSWLCGTNCGAWQWLCSSLVEHQLWEEKRPGFVWGEMSIPTYIWMFLWRKWFYSLDDNSIINSFSNMAMPRHTEQQEPYLFFRPRVLTSCLVLLTPRSQPHRTLLGLFGSCYSIDGTLTFYSVRIGRCGQWRMTGNELTLCEQTGRFCSQTLWRPPTGPRGLHSILHCWWKGMFTVSFHVPYQPCLCDFHKNVGTEVAMEFYWNVAICLKAVNLLPLNR